MPEYVHAWRELEGVDRKKELADLDFAVKLSIWPWPNLGAVSFTFDCESTYGGSKVDNGEIETINKLREVFDNVKIQSTFNIVGKFAKQNSAVIENLDNSNQDIAGHGYSHVYLDHLPVTEQEKEIKKTISVIKKIIGREIKGWRSPYGTFDKNTYTLLEKFNFEWGSNWGRSLWGDIPFRPIIGNRLFNIVEIPFDDNHFDAKVYNKYYIKPSQVELLYRNQIEEAIENNSLFVILNHPIVLADDKKRIDVIKNLVKFCKSKAIWVASCSQIAKRWILFKNTDLKIHSLKTREKSTDIELSIANRNNESLKNLALIIKNDSGIEETSSSSETLIMRGNLQRCNKALIKVPEISPNSEIDVTLQLKRK